MSDYRERLEHAKRASTFQLLFRAARLIDEEALRRIGEKRGRPPLRRAHTALLPHIDLEGTRVGDLASRLGITKQAVSQLIDDLESMGVVERAVDPDDARARIVRFTQKGRAGLLDGLSVLKGLEEEAARAIGAARMKELHTTLEKLLTHIEGTPLTK
jgi:DNA-binding MarR family transcriptional regulator